jgi:hypothetical protein
MELSCTAANLHKYDVFLVFADGKNPIHRAGFSKKRFVD